MKKVLLIFTTLVALLASCSDGGLAPIARKHLNAKVNEEMSTFLGTVGETRIEGLELIYNCDSLSIFQGYAIGKDSEGKEIKESIRYIFAKDTFISAVSGKPTYYEAVRGGDYLSKQGIKDFQKTMNEGGPNLFNNYLVMGELLNQQ